MWTGCGIWAPHLKVHFLPEGCCRHLLFKHGAGPRPRPTCATSSAIREGKTLSRDSAKRLACRLAKSQSHILRLVGFCERWALGTLAPITVPVLCPLVLQLTMALVPMISGYFWMAIRLHEQACQGFGAQGVRCLTRGAWGAGEGLALYGSEMQQWSSRITPLGMLGAEIKFT